MPLPSPLKLWIQPAWTGSYFDHLHSKMCGWRTWCEGDPDWRQDLPKSGPDYTYQLQPRLAARRLSTTTSLCLRWRCGEKPRSVSLTSPPTVPRHVTMSYKGGAVPAEFETIKDLRVKVTGWWTQTADHPHDAQGGPDQ